MNNYGIRRGGNKMGEVKKNAIERQFFSATFDDGHEEIGVTGGSYFYWQSPRAGDTIFVTMAVLISDLRDLTKLSFFAHLNNGEEG